MIWCIRMSTYMYTYGCVCMVLSVAVHNRRIDYNILSTMLCSEEQKLYPKLTHTETGFGFDHYENPSYRGPRTEHTETSGPPPSP